MKVKRIEIRNFKAIQEADIDLNSSHLMIIGKNGVGKSTIGKLVQDLLTKNTPVKPLKEGEKQGYCQVELSDGSIIHYAFDEVGQKLNIISKTEQGSLAQILKKLSGKGMSFDIDAFLQMAPKPRKEMLMQVAGIDLTHLEARYNQAYQQRAEANMKLKTQQARIKPYSEELVGKEKVDLVKITNQYNEALAHNLQINTLTEKAGNLDAEISELKKKLALLEQERLDVQNYLNNNIPITSAAITDMQKQIGEAEGINAKIDEANRLSEEFSLAEKYEKEASQAHNLLLSIEVEKETILKNANLPAGICFTSEGLEIDGLPFESNQIATSRKMIAALEIAERMLGDIRYLHFDASILDKQNAQKIIDWANERDLQLCLERALWDGGELSYEIIEPQTTS
jgi:recombinational DNA repair ATPase RecF